MNGHVALSQLPFCSQVLSAPGVIFQISTYHQGLAIIKEVKLTNGS